MLLIGCYHEWVVGFFPARGASVDGAVQEASQGTRLTKNFEAISLFRIFIKSLKKNEK